MWLILSEDVDEDAVVLAGRLRGRGLVPLMHLTSDELGYARWVYRSGSRGESSELRLSDGATVSSTSLRGVVNRLVAVPASALAHVAKQDREYASAELMALYMSWLNGLTCPVLNRPTASMLCGFWPDTSEWIRRAFSAGLPAQPFAWVDSDPPSMRLGMTQLAPGEEIETLFLLDGAIIGGESPRGISAECERFARRTGNRLMGMLFATSPEGSRRFVDATPLPYLSTAPEATIAAVAAALSSP